MRSRRKATSSSVAVWVHGGSPDLLTALFFNWSLFPAELSDDLTCLTLATAGSMAGFLTRLSFVSKKTNKVLTIIYILIASDLGYILTTKYWGFINIMAMLP